jgi:TfoX/Sxy family transcriptional regulator of competence genes
MRTAAEKDNEAGARALQATGDMLTKMGDARIAYEAVKKDYWISYWIVYEQALRDMEDEDERN